MTSATSLCENDRNLQTASDLRSGRTQESRKLRERKILADRAENLLMRLLPFDKEVEMIEIKTTGNKWKEHILCQYLIKEL